jgi:hypothetical protein
LIRNQELANEILGTLTDVFKLGLLHRVVAGQDVIICFLKQKKSLLSVALNMIFYKIFSLVSSHEQNRQIIDNPLERQKIE